MNRLTGIVCLALAGCVAPSAPDADPTVATFSIVACDPATGEVGCATQSKVLAVGAIGLAAWLFFGALVEWSERVKLFRAPLAETWHRARGLPRAASYGASKFRAQTS